MNKSILIKFLLSSCFLLLISCEEILFEKDISKNEIVLVAPINNAPFFSTGVTFTWETVEGATKYQLQIAKPNFTNPLQIVLDTIITKTNFTQQLPIGEYEWKTKALNESYETKYSKRSFSIISNTDFQSNIVVLNSPKNNFTTNTTIQNLSWQQIIGATGYQIKIMDSNNTLINDRLVTQTSLNFTFPEGTFEWNVKASNGAVQTLDSSRSILIDTTPPNTPILTSPSNASTTTNREVSFQWNRTPILGSSEKDSIYIYTNSTLTTLQLKKEANSPTVIKLDLNTYYWFVKSFDQAGNSSNKSSIFSFIIN